jgi:hypothetical protein
MAEFGMFPYYGVAASKVLELDDSQFEALRRAVAGETAFSRSRARLEALQAELGGTFTVSEVFYLLVSLEELYDQLREWTKGGGRSREEELAEFVEVTGFLRDAGDRQDEARRRLLALTQENPALEHKRKLHWLRTGILETAVEFASFVDLRPSFDETRNTIDDVVASVVLRVGTETSGGDNRSHVFQLTDDGLVKLKAIVDDIEKKLATIKAKSMFRMEAK